MSRNNLWRLVAAVLAFVIILKDQLSKWWVMSHLFGDMYKDGAPSFTQWLTSTGERLHHDAIQVTDFFSWVMVWNPGISFGMLHTDSNIMTYILSAIAIAVAIGFFAWMWRDPRPLMAVCVGMIVGGALGNVIDRLRFGAVVDFLDFSIGTYHWPAFNVADASISIGVVLLLVDMMLFPSKTSSGDFK